MLGLNDCKRLQSLPKLSVVNEDTLYGLQMRSIYIISKRRVDVSKFHVTSNNTSSMVSCLNCPKVAEKENGVHLAERILNGYLQSRTRYWIIPEAVFEIVGAGCEIPSGFKMIRSDESLTLVGPWIGVVICAVVTSHHIDAAMETKYMVTAHVHVGEKYWRIPVPVNFLAAGLENQLIFYWTRAGDLQRTVDSSQENTFNFSFSVEPRDCKVEVIKFGACLIREEDILQLKELKDSTSGFVDFVVNGACEASTFVWSCYPSMSHDFIRSITFICDYGKQLYSLVDMHMIIKSLIGINQGVLSECKEEWSHKELFPLFYDYYQIIQGTSDLYSDFLRLLKDACDSLLSVKLALEQVVTKSRTYNDYTYIEMLEQLNDLEAADGIKFCDNFITSLAFICMRTVNFSGHLNEEIQNIKTCKSGIRLVKVSTITIPCIFSILATYMLSDEQLQVMKGVSSYPSWWNLIRSFLHRDEWSPVMRSYRKELRIWDFIGSAVILQELKARMARFVSFTRQSEEEMMIAINKLEKMTDNISGTIEDMCRHAHLYSLDIRRAGNTLNQFIADSNLQLSITGVQFMPPNEEQEYGSPVSEAMSILYRATLCLTLTDIQCYIRACEEEEEADDTSLLTCNSIIHDNTSRIIKIICDPPSIGGQNSMDEICKVITCLHTINQEAFKVLSKCEEEWRHHTNLFHLVNDYHKICLQTSHLYIDFVRLLKDQLDSHMSVIVRLREHARSFSQGFLRQNYIVTQDFGNFTVSGDFMKSLAYTCKQTLSYTSHFDEKIQELKLVKVLAKVSSGLIAGVFSVMAAFMVDRTPFHWMKEKTLTSMWLYFMRSFSWKSPSPLWKDDQLVIKDFFDKDVTSRFAYADNESLMIVIDDLQLNIEKLLVTIEEMSMHAHKCSHDTIQAGKALKLISHNPVAEPA